MAKLIKESDYFLTWLVFSICGTVGGFILGAVVGGVTGAILNVVGVDLAGNVFKWTCSGMGFIAGLVMSYVFFRIFVASMIVKKAEMRSQALTQPSPQ